MPRVLLAEDDDAVRDMLRAALERDGFEVVAAADDNALCWVVGNDADVAGKVARPARTAAEPRFEHRSGDPLAERGTER